MPRSYKIPFSVACTGATDLAWGQVASGKFARFTGFTVNDVDTGGSPPTSQQLAINCVLIETPSGGATGGGAVTPVKDDPGNTNPTTDGYAGATSVTTGTVIAIGYQGGCYVTQGIVQNFKFDTPIPALGGERMVLQLPDAPAGTVTLSGTLNFEEEGG